jgi:hypothetical protein
MQGDSEDLKAQMKAVRIRERADRRNWFGRHRFAAIALAALLLLGVLGLLSVLRAEAEGSNRDALDAAPQHMSRLMNQPGTAA